MAQSAMPATYVSLGEAQDYFDWKWNSTAWDEASNDDKGKAIVEATRRIDRLNFAGVRSSDFNRFADANRNCGFVMGPSILDPSSDTPSPGQALEFPRNGSDTIPKDIKDACCEIALALLDGVDPEQEMKMLASMAQKFAGASASYDPGAARMAVRHGIPSYTAWNLLYPYLADPLETNLTRVS